MSNRDAPSVVGGGLGAALGALSNGLKRLAVRVAKLEATVSGQTAPADTRFEGVVNDDGELEVWMVRVSTGDRQKITTLG